MSLLSDCFIGEHLYLTLREREEFAEYFAEDPLPREALEGSERDGEQTHEDVGGRQVQDEEVGDGVHGPRPDHGRAHQQVAQGADAVQGQNEEKCVL